MIRLVRVKRYRNASVVGVLEVVIYQYVVFQSTVCSVVVTLFNVARLNFLGTLLPILSIYYVGISKDIGKKLPQL